ncbi:MAG TPA: MBL fold metallo-hydrolase [Acidimicrobiales bacterium]|nr:MBL fold metallo-hydrolase [Acidimicrobiales bacterium]
MAIPYVYDIDVEYGRCDRVAPRIRRVVANNPSKFTFKGTGTYIVGEGDVAIIDAGPRDTAHVDALVRTVSGERVTHLLITHTHGDHSPAAAMLKQRVGDIPTYGFGPHPLRPDDERAWAEANPDEPDPELDAAIAAADAEAAAKLSEAPKLEEHPDYDYAPDVVLADGQQIDGNGFRFTALHTPGHISNHMCFALEPRTRSDAEIVFTGDHVMGWSTTIVPPPDGDMVAYFASLQRLLHHRDATYYPTHGPPIAHGHDYVTALLAHRRERESQVLEQLASGPRTILTMVKVIYADVGVELHRPASRSVLAHLFKLVDEGRVLCDTVVPTLRSTYSLAPNAPLAGG